jgi:hypothetical protein
LRYKIWSYASRVPQKVKLCITTNDYSAVAILGGPKIPAILHGCFESRKVALKFYTLCRQEIVPGSELLDNIKTHRRSMYVNFDIYRFRITGDSILRPPPDPILFGYSRPSYRYTYSLDIVRQIHLVELEIDTISKPRERWTCQITRLWEVLVECCPGYVKNGKCFREKGNMEENAEYLLYVSASGLF